MRKRKVSIELPSHACRWMFQLLSNDRYVDKEPDAATVMVNAANDCCDPGYYLLS